MKSSKLNLTAKQLRVITWMDDVTGMDNKIEGNELVIFYKGMPTYWEHRISMEDVAEILHDIINIEDENFSLANN